jgi:PleD family two-component response regulator
MYPTPEAFIEAADQAMYSAKRSGGEKVRIATTESSG